MSVLSLQWLWVRPQRRTYPDSFFADPVAVEDDSRRMQHGIHPVRRRGR
jgi:hypothetical protein